MLFPDGTSYWLWYGLVSWWLQLRLFNGRRFLPDRNATGNDTQDCEIGIKSLLVCIVVSRLSKRPSILCSNDDDVGSVRNFFENNYIYNNYTFMSSSYPKFMQYPKTLPVC